MSVQIGLLLTMAVLLLRPWRLFTRRRCDLCRTSTARHRARCRFCGATAVDSAERTRPESIPSRHGRYVDEL